MRVEVNAAIARKEEPRWQGKMKGMMLGFRKQQGQGGNNMINMCDVESALFDSFGSVLLGNVNIKFNMALNIFRTFESAWMRVTAAAASLHGVRAAPCWTVKLYSRWCKQHCFSAAINGHPSRTFTTGGAWRRAIKSGRTKSNPVLNFAFFFFFCFFFFYNLKSLLEFNLQS